MSYNAAKIRFRPQSAILTLCGAYLLNRGGDIGIGSLIVLLENFGVSEEAIRSAVSRMRRAGLLKVRRVGKKSFYSLSDSGYGLLTKGAGRIFKRENTEWDGTWNIVTYSIPERRRQARDRLRLELGWMGYGALSGGTWVSPHNSTKEVEDLAKSLGISDNIQIFSAQHEGHTDPKQIVSRCWNLNRIHEEYTSFLAKYSPRLEDHLRRIQTGKVIEPSECFVERFSLIHEYRRLPYFDPDLPSVILPKNWLRSQASALFHQYHDLLAEKANDYFESVLRTYRGLSPNKTGLLSN